MRNRYPGKCYFCNDNVAAGAGHFERIPSSISGKGGWQVIHAECVFKNREKKRQKLAAVSIA